MDISEQLEQEKSILPQPSSKRKYLVIGIIAAVIVVGGMALFLWQNSTVCCDIPLIEEDQIIDTSDWQTYRIDKPYYLGDGNGFEFQYPKGIVLNHGRGFGFQVDLMWEDVECFRGYCPVLFDVWGRPVDQDSLEEYLKDLFDLEKFEEFQDKENWRGSNVDLIAQTRFGKDEKLSGYKVHDLFFEEGRCGYYTKRGENVFEISRVASGLTFADCDKDELFNQILSTFRFIEPIDTSDWQTYRNQEFGFEVKYPEGWDIVQSGALGVFWFGREAFPTPEECDRCWSSGYYSDGSAHPWPGLSISSRGDLYSSEELGRAEVTEGFIEDEGMLYDQYRYEPLIFSEVPANRFTTVSPRIEGPRHSRIIFNTIEYGWTISYPTTDYEGGHDPIYDQILSTFRFVEVIGTSNEDTEELLKIAAPQNYPEPKVYENLFDSFLDYEFYDVNHFSGLELPVISSIKLVSEESTKNYIDDSSSEEIRDRRNVLSEDFHGQKEALDNSNDYKEDVFKEIGGYSYLVSPRVCLGDIYGCSLIRYTTFFDDVRVDISVGFEEKTTDNEMDELVSQVEISARSGM